MASQRTKPPGTPSSSSTRTGPPFPPPQKTRPPFPGPPAPSEGAEATPPTLEKTDANLPESLADTAERRRQALERIAAANAQPATDPDLQPSEPEAGGQNSE